MFEYLCGNAGAFACRLTQIDQAHFGQKKAR